MGRINEVLSVGVGNKRAYQTGAELLTDMVEQILGLDIPYYVLVDFAGFQDVVDTLGGVMVEVPKSFVDTTYPGPNNSYITVRFS